jgi:hypothetical protein
MSSINAIRIQANSNRFANIGYCILSRLQISDSKAPAESTYRCRQEHPIELSDSVDAHASFLAPNYYWFENHQSINWATAQLELHEQNAKAIFHLGNCFVNLRAMYTQV